MAYRAKASYYRGKLILPFNAGSGRAEVESDDLLLRPTFPTSPTYWFGWDTTLRFSQAAIQCPAPILFLAPRWRYGSMRIELVIMSPSCGKEGTSAL